MLPDKDCQAITTSQPTAAKRPSGGDHYAVHTQAGRRAEHWLVLAQEVRGWRSRGARTTRLFRGARSVGHCSAAGLAYGWRIWERRAALAIEDELRDAWMSSCRVRCLLVTRRSLRCWPDLERASNTEPRSGTRRAWGAALTISNAAFARETKRIMIGGTMYSNQLEIIKHVG